MTVENIKALLDACYQAKRVRELLPVLPKGVTSSYIHYLDTIEHLEQRGVRVKVSDISDTLDIPRPGVTRTVKEMEDQAATSKKRRRKKMDASPTSQSQMRAKSCQQTYNAAVFRAACAAARQTSRTTMPRVPSARLKSSTDVMSERRITLAY